MNFEISRLRARRTTRLAFLLGGASLATLASSEAYAAAAAPVVAAAPAPVEEILITGSLITGAPAIGLPVSTLGEQELTESGALNITEMLETMTVFDIP